MRPAAVVVDNQQIVAIENATALDRNLEHHDLGDLVISPGIIDAHAHVNEPGTDWEGFESATRAAAAGGITTLIDMPLNSLPVTTTADALAKKRAAARGRCWVDVGFYGGLIPGNVQDIPTLIESGVFGIKSFLCHSGLDEFPNSTEADLQSALPYLKRVGVPLLVHAELYDAAHRSQPDGNTSYAAYVASRPDDWEVRAIELLIRLCRQFESPIHIVHLATEQALPLIAAAKQDGLPLTVETCPHYLYFAAERIPDGETRCKCAPPIRSELNRKMLCGALGQGIIDTIGSDHSPCNPARKLLESGDLTRAWGGISGLQLSLPVVWTAGQQIGWQPSQLATWFSVNPARLLGLDQHKGKLAPGFDADIVVWDPEAAFEVDADKLYHRHKISAYVGQRLLGVVRQTFVRGSSAFDQNGVSREPFGQLMIRGGNRPIADPVSGYLNRLAEADARGAFEKCCAAETWIDGMVAGMPFQSDADVEAKAAGIWNGLDREARLAAFAAHPRIGDIDSLRAKFANTSNWAMGEQAGAATASEATLERLAELNDAYLEKFGYIFIVCATGKTAEQMLAILESRLSNDADNELEIASAEQLKITLLRLRKLAP